MQPHFKDPRSCTRIAKVVLDLVISRRKKVMAAVDDGDVIAYWTMDHEELFDFLVEREVGEIECHTKGKRFFLHVQPLGER